MPVGTTCRRRALLDGRAGGLPGSGIEGDPPPPPEQISPWHFPPEARSLFTEVASLCYPPFEVRYSSADYLANLATQSGTRALGEARSAEVLARVRRRLESSGWPRLTATFVGYLTVGQKIMN